MKAVPLLDLLRGRLCVSAALVLLAVSVAVRADQDTPAAPTQLDRDIREAVLQVPVSVQDAFGKTVAGELPVTIFRPPGAGPFPLVLISHGRWTPTRATMARPRFESAARFFVRKGFAVAVPQRLGYGPDTASLGDPEDHTDCARPRYRAALDAAASEVAQVVRVLQAQPDIDPKRLVLLGQSVGGAATVAANAISPALPGLVAAINFAGGHGGNPEARPGEPCSAPTLGNTLGSYGRTAASPMLWVYTENDRFFNPRYPQAWAKAFRDAGGAVDLRLLGAFGNDGHTLFAQGNDIWQPLVDEFLAGHGFATPGSLSKPDTRGASAADDPAALSMLPERVQADYKTFLAGSAPRAFAIAVDAQGRPIPTRWGWATKDDVLSRALANCQRRSGASCRLFAVNEHWVWHAK